MITRFHYEDLIYQQLLNDELSREEQESVTRHIEECEACQTKLESMSQHSVSWDDIRRYLDPKQTECLDSLHANGDDFGKKVSTSLSFLSSSDKENSLGRFGRFEVSEVLGRGGMGVVLRGYDPSLNRHSAIKVLSPELAANAAARKRFSREAKAAAAVVHENVIPILTVDEEQGLPYLVMPVVEGRSLEQRVDDTGPMEPKEILRIGMQIASGLAAAHAQGLVHRDVKPANILLENGVERVMITDFGLARAVDDASMTRSGVITGTPQYMSPEQSRGTEIDCRSDLFSIGSVLYFMCTGHSPFRAETTMGVLHRVVNDEPRSVRAVNPDIPNWLNEIIMRLLEKAPGARYQSAEAVAHELGAGLAHLQQPNKFPTPGTLNDKSSQYPHTISPQNGTRKWQFTLRTFLLAVTAVVTLLVLSNWCYFWYTSTSLDTAVKEFNLEASQHPVGKHEPELTTDEVVFAIKSQLGELDGIANSIYSRIARSRRIPREASLHSIAKYTPASGERLTVWYINLDIKTFANRGYALRIRSTAKPVAARGTRSRRSVDVSGPQETSGPRGGDVLEGGTE